MSQNSQPKAPSGMRAFLIVMFGQFFSLTGTGMTRFALTLFVWSKTEQATALALVAFFATLPVILFSPVAGALVDRWNRKLTMMLSDLGAGAMTIFILLLSLSGTLEIWHLYIAAAITGFFETFQFPAYSSAISMMVKKEDYGRTSAMQGLVEAASFIISPIFAAALYGVIGLNGILLIDIATFTLAVGTLIFVFIPQPPPSTQDTPKNSLWQDSLFGFGYIWSRRPLFYLQMVFFFGNLFFSMSFTLIAPMILARTGNDEAVLAGVNAVFGVGGVLGGLFLSWWGGPKRKIHGVMGVWFLSALFGMIGMGLSQTPLLWAVMGFLVTFFMPIVNASNQAIWMSKVPPALQGRVFSIRRLIAQVTGPIALFIVGPLADNVFEPAMMAGGALAPTFGAWVGTGLGAGMALMMVMSGVLLVVITGAMFMLPMVRNVESIIPDHDQDAMAVAAAS